MAKTIKVKKNDIPEDIEGCRLVPINKGKSHFPKVQDNVLPNTYYRVPVDDENRLRAMVTIMPDDRIIAWDTCGKCKGHVSYCQCKSGIYHPASIGWIRATFDINYPTERVMDYSKYNDPYKRLVGVNIDPYEEGLGRKPNYNDKPRPAKKKVDEELPPVRPKAKGKELSVQEIENLDLEKLGQEASKQAKRTIRRARSAIRGGKR